MMIFGSGTIVSQLTLHSLIDEYQLVVCPIYLAGGRPLLTDVSNDTKLRLIEAQPYSAGDVMLRYAISLATLTGRRVDLAD
jgi:dihydrofolate reductase